MKTAARILIVVSAVMFAVLFAACGNKGEQTLEERYGIHDYSAVFYENGMTEFENHGNGTDEKTVYELASNGKTVAAYTALAMVDGGVLSLDDRIAPYLDPDLVTDDARINDITLRQLLCHTAGFSPNYELGTDKKIYSGPGTEFRYSGVGYIYLQNVIENASGMTIDQAASQYVFGPLGMENSTFESAGTIVPYINAGSAVLYSLLVFAASFALLIIAAGLTGKLTKFRFFSFKTAFVICFIAAGIINSAFLLFFFVSKVFVLFLISVAAMGTAMFLTRKKKLFYACVPAITVVLFILGYALPVSVPVTNDLTAKEANCAYTFKSTAEDMSLFCGELMERAKDPDDALNIMFHPAVSTGDGNAWGLGIAIENAGGTETTYWHSGINPDFQSLFVLYPGEDKYAVILTNSDSGLDFSKELARRHLGVDGEWDIPRG